MIFPFPAENFHEKCIKQQTINIKYHLNIYNISTKSNQICLGCHHPRVFIYLILHNPPSLTSFLMQHIIHSVNSCSMYTFCFAYSIFNICTRDRFMQITEKNIISVVVIRRASWMSSRKASRVRQHIHPAFIFLGLPQIEENEISCMTKDKYESADIEWIWEGSRRMAGK